MRAAGAAVVVLVEAAEAPVVALGGAADKSAGAPVVARGGAVDAAERGPGEMVEAGGVARTATPPARILGQDRWRVRGRRVPGKVPGTSSPPRSVDTAGYVLLRLHIWAAAAAEAVPAGAAAARVVPAGAAELVLAVASVTTAAVAAMGLVVRAAAAALALAVILGASAIWKSGSV